MLTIVTADKPNSTTYPWVGLYQPNLTLNLVVVFTRCRQGICLNDDSATSQLGKTRADWDEKLFKPTEIILSSTRES